MNKSTFNAIQRSLLIALALLTLISFLLGLTNTASFGFVCFTGLGFIVYLTNKWGF